MDLIYTNAKGADQGVFKAYSFDLSYGADENDFELTLGENESALESGAFIYMESTEYGGTVGGIKTSTNGATVTYTGRTWHGILNSKVIEPDTGEDYLVVSGDANEVLAFLVARLGLSALFVAASELSGVSIFDYKFARYCKGYDGIRALLTANGAKLKMVWENRQVLLWAEPATDYTDDPLDADTASLSVEQYQKKVNHLVCLGAGELAEREVIHLYADKDGAISETQYYTGLEEIADTYESSATEDLRGDGEKRLKKLRNTDKAEISLQEASKRVYDIGDIVSATERKTSVTVSQAVTQKIVKINNGAVSIEYKTGG